MDDSAPVSTAAEVLDLQQQEVKAAEDQRWQRAERARIWNKELQDARSRSGSRSPPLDQQEKLETPPAPDDNGATSTAWQSKMIEMQSQILSSMVVQHSSGSTSQLEILKRQGEAQHKQIMALRQANVGAWDWIASVQQVEKGLQNEIAALREENEVLRLMLENTTHTASTVPAPKACSVPLSELHVENQYMHMGHHVEVLDIVKARDDNEKVKEIDQEPADVINGLEGCAEVPDQMMQGVRDISSTYQQPDLGAAVELSTSSNSPSSAVQQESHVGDDSAKPTRCKICYRQIQNCTCVTSTDTPEVQVIHNEASIAPVLEKADSVKADQYVDAPIGDPHESDDDLADILAECCPSDEHNLPDVICKDVDEERSVTGAGSTMERQSIHSPSEQTILCEIDQLAGELKPFVAEREWSAMHMYIRECQGLRSPKRQQKKLLGILKDRLHQFTQEESSTMIQISAAQHEEEMENLRAQLVADQAKMREQLIQQHEASLVQFATEREAEQVKLIAEKECVLEKLQSVQKARVLLEEDAARAAKQATAEIERAVQNSTEEIDLLKTQLLEQKARNTLHEANAREATANQEQRYQQEVQVSPSHVWSCAFLCVQVDMLMAQLLEEQNTKMQLAEEQSTRIEQLCAECKEEVERVTEQFQEEVAVLQGRLRIEMHHKAQLEDQGEKSKSDAQGSVMKLQRENERLMQQVTELEVLLREERTSKAQLQKEVHENAKKLFAKSDGLDENPDSALQVEALRFANWKKEREKAKLEAAVPTLEPESLDGRKMSADLCALLKF